MEYLEYTTTYVRTEFRLMQAINSGYDLELTRGTIEECIAAREAYFEKDPKKFPMRAFYFQAHYPNGHPEYPGAGGCWVKYDLLTGV